MFSYLVSNISIFIISKTFAENLQPYWNFFKSPADVPPDFTIEILPQQIGRYGLETLPFLEGETRLIRNGSEVMLVNRDWTHCRILSPENWDLASAFLTMAFDTHAVQRPDDPPPLLHHRRPGQGSPFPGSFRHRQNHSGGALAGLPWFPDY